jgi:hypothetical protein
MKVTAILLKEVKEITSHFLYGCFNYDETVLDNDVEEYCNVKVPVPQAI